MKVNTKFAIIRNSFGRRGRVTGAKKSATIVLLGNTVELGLHISKLGSKSAEWFTHHCPENWSAIARELQLGPEETCRFYTPAEHVREYAEEHKSKLWSVCIVPAVFTVTNQSSWWDIDFSNPEFVLLPMSQR